MHRPSRTPSPSPRILRDFLPEDQWWKFYINPKDHQQALKKFPRDPGSLYDNDLSPGFKQGMVSAYKQFLDDPATVRTPMNSTSYKTLHGVATGSLTRRQSAAGTSIQVQREIKWSGGAATQFPLRGNALAPDIFPEKVGERSLVYDITTHNWAGGLPNPQPVTIFTRVLHSNPALATNYKVDEAPRLVDTVFTQHYATVHRPGANDSTKLASIARTVRSLQVIHPFGDGNLRSNVQVLLPKLLLELGFRPVVPDDMYSLFQGGFSVVDMVTSLIRNGVQTR